MSAQALSDSNGFRSADRDKGLARAADRSDTIADRAGVQPGKGHKPGKSHTSRHPNGDAFGHMASKP